MDENKRNKLEAKLKQMIEFERQVQTRKNQRKIQSGTGNVIRRRKGEADKRIAL